MIHYGEKIRNSVPKAFMMTPIHVLFSNFTEIGRQKVGETMRTVRCLGDKEVRKMRFFAAILRPFGGGRQKCAEERPT